MQSVVNIARLALGLAVFAFALLYVKQQPSYNTGWPDAQRIHPLVVEQRRMPEAANGEFTSINARSWPLVAEYFVAETEAISRVHALAVRVNHRGTVPVALFVAGTHDKSDRVYIEV